MRILFDLRMLSGDHSGISAYAVNLLSGLGSLSIPHEIILLSRNSSCFKRWNGRVFSYLDKHGGKSVFLDLSTFHPLNFFGLRRLIKNEQIHLYYTPDFFWPYGSLPCPVISTIHDVIPVTHSKWMPHSTKARFRLLFKELIRFTLMFSSRVCVASETTLKTLEKIFGSPLIRHCRVLHTPVDFSDNKTTNAPLPWDLNEGFILYVGRLDPYKNVPSLIRAFHELKKEGIKEKLVIAGKRDPRYPETSHLVESLRIQNEVIFTDFVSEDVLRQLYGQCRFSVQPSLAEGFGLTALEPYVYKKFCIASRAASLPEVLGEAGLFFDPQNTEDIKKTIKRGLMLTEDEKKQLVGKGLKQLELFHSTKTAEKWLDLVKEILPSSNK
ncbi:MAG: glycosyltransferase family 4 protein [Candidatus Aureabacteria bacterium]|nr:glycosyltransferase family 4 protein [Candidatus Auribacterota bacterium]